MKENDNKQPCKQGNRGAENDTQQTLRDDDNAFMEKEGTMSHNPRQLCNRRKFT